MSKVYEGKAVGMKAIECHVDGFYQSSSRGWTAEDWKLLIDVLLYCLYFNTLGMIFVVQLILTL